MKIKIFNSDASVGTKSEVKVDSEIFGQSENPKLLAQVVRVLRGNLRRTTAHTKNRGDVSGGGKKPFRQKGTGNARAGSTRSPLWRGGGVTFGPRKVRNYKKRIPQKMANKTLKIALSEKFKNNKFIVVKKLAFPKISTRQFQSFLEKLPIEEGRILMLVAVTNPNLELSAANLPYLKTILPSGLNLLDVINYDYVITDKEGLEALQKKFTKKEKV